MNWLSTGCFSAHSGKTRAQRPYSVLWQLPKGIRPLLDSESPPESWMFLTFRGALLGHAFAIATVCVEGYAGFIPPPRCCSPFYPLKMFAASTFVRTKGHGWFGWTDHVLSPKKQKGLSKKQKSGFKILNPLPVSHTLFEWRFRKTNSP